MKKHLSILLFLFALCLTSSLAAQSKKATHHFAIENGSFMYDGKPIQIHSGEMHFARIPAPYWRHRLKMMKAMGLNAVASYVFWNYHETAPGVWNWQTGNHNIRRFIQTAAEEGMMVILRPGPYCCAEWEYGGYPWWLQNEKSLVVRTVNQPFQDSCRVYLNQLGAQLRDLQITHGGPIVMVQAENEFGSYVAQRKDIPLATHKAYSASIRQMLLDAGFDIPMFTSDGSWLFEGGTIEGALPTANGEDNVEKLKQVVNQYHGGQGPYMVAEYYPGWLDHWNEPFQKVKTESVVAQLEKYLKSNVNFNIYMVHGGTNFGFTSGANYSNATNIQPDLTSYDYDAPISEAGWATPKYMAIRNLLKKYTSRTLPAVPKAIPVVAIPLIKMTPVANFFDIIARMKPVTSDRPMSFEQLNQGFGYVLYRKHFNLSVHGLLKVNGLADYALVYVNGVKKGELNRLIDKDSLLIDIPTDANLDIFVENLGRINYGARITDNQKGITGTVVLNGNEMIGDWQIYGLPMSTAPRAISKTATYKKGQPIVYRGTFRVRHIGDTFLDMSRWGKGIVFVNGVNLGRYWKVGPQQTLYLPGCFLHRGKNSIVVFEQQNDVRQSVLTGIKTPILDRLVK